MDDTPLTMEGDHRFSVTIGMEGDRSTNLKISLKAMEQFLLVHRPDLMVHELKLVLEVK